MATSGSPETAANPRHVTLVIPAAGRGSRMCPVCGSLPKALVPVRGNPLLSYVLDAGTKAPIQHIVVVTSPAGGLIQQRFGAAHNGVPITYVSQDEPRGLADAVMRAKGYVEDLMLVVNGDELFINSQHDQLVQRLRDSAADGLVGYVRTTSSWRISTGYALSLDHAGRVLRLLEKPQVPWNDLLGVGTWLLGRDYFHYFTRTPVQEARGERDFVMVLQSMVDDGLSLYGVDLRGEFINVNTPVDLLAADALLAEAETSAAITHTSRDHAIQVAAR
jgi:glucose-1-phosphate thymidylyltransferase